MDDNNDDKNFFNEIIGSVDFIKFLLSENKILNNLAPDSTLEIPLLRSKNVLFPGIYVSIPISNKNEINLINDLHVNSKFLGIITTKNNNKGTYEIGTTAQILKIININENKIQVVLQGIDKFKLEKTNTDVLGNLFGNIRILKDEDYDVNSIKYKAIENNIKELIGDMISLHQNFPNEIKVFIEQNNDLNLLIYLLASSLNADVKEKQQLLEENDILKRGIMLIKFLKRDIELAELKKRILTKAQNSINKRQKDFFVKQQIEALKDELNDGSSADYDNEIEELRVKGSKKTWNKKTKEFFDKLLRKAEKSIQNNADYTILVNQAEFLLDLPWEKYSKDKIDIKKAAQVLDENHFGMEKVKDRILEYLSVLKLNNSNVKSMKGQILCLYGPPGVGKTSLCRSIAKALNRDYLKVALGGIDDEAEIRGHRKTYIGAMAGRILKGLQNVKTSNPVFVLDEIDKMVKNQGDPSAALLEVLDPDQNKEFVDHYVETPYDLSKVMFIATANDINNIPDALKDRLELIEVTGYAIEEKIEIAKRYIIPELLKEHGLKEKDVTFKGNVIEKIIDNYTRESGVRELKRQIATIMRKITRKIVEKEDYDKVIDEKNVEKYIGIPRFDRDLAQKMDKPGVAIGLAWTCVGGDILFIESTKMKGDGKLTLSGKLGDVMKESANLAFTYLKSHCEEFNIKSEVFKENDFHIHVPDGATPKDGPSAGITLFTTLYSLLLNKPIKNNLAMTGEITLRGKVTAVGGIKEKVLAAKRAGIKTIIMCKDNKKDVSEIKKEYISNIKFEYISSIEELTKLII